eukprot:CAMPEP_0184484176 /NCGR_PEP_ID=MMETSP0113_2-20130426/5888_1 /TAXON_ID=91329 /ORGANISM="Norrisiella sphaerica, Strain BC52" /LENGTH=557 /DNA_ID=CAMNT_0026865033 /DNA_START=155 /DNA_END=1825 /DNA_ORIENTATION=-
MPTQKNSSEASGTLKKRPPKPKPPKPNPPKKARTAYNFFQQSARQLDIRKNEGGDGDAQNRNIAKDIGLAWKKLSPEQKRVYIEMAAKDRQRYENEAAVYYAAVKAAEGSDGSAAAIGEISPFVQSNQEAKLKKQQTNNRKHQKEKKPKKRPQKFTQEGKQKSESKALPTQPVYPVHRNPPHSGPYAAVKSSTQMRSGHALLEPRMIPTPTHPINQQQSQPQPQPAPSASHPLPQQSKEAQGQIQVPSQMQIMASSMPYWPNPNNINDYRIAYQQAQMMQANFQSQPTMMQMQRTPQLMQAQQMTQAQIHHNPHNQFAAVPHHQMQQRPHQMAQNITPNAGTNANFRIVQPVSNQQIEMHPGSIQPQLLNQQWSLSQPQPHYLPMFTPNTDSWQYLQQNQGFTVLQDGRMIMQQMPPQVSTQGVPFQQGQLQYNLQSPAQATQQVAAKKKDKEQISVPHSKKERKRPATRKRKTVTGKAALRKKGGRQKMKRSWPTKQEKVPEVSKTQEDEALDTQHRRRFLNSQRDDETDFVKDKSAFFDPRTRHLSTSGNMDEFW